MSSSSENEDMVVRVECKSFALSLSPFLLRPRDKKKQVSQSSLSLSLASTARKKPSLHTCRLFFIKRLSNSLLRVPRGGATEPRTTRSRRERSLARALSSPFWARSVFLFSTSSTYSFPRLKLGCCLRPRSRSPPSWLTRRSRHFPCLLRSCRLCFARRGASCEEWRGRTRTGKKERERQREIVVFFSSSST